jgi:hypothetical protein
MEAAKQLDDLIRGFAKHLIYSEQLEVLSQTIKLFRSLGFRRKAAYYSKLAYNLAVKTDDHGKAQAFLLDTVDMYQVNRSRPELHEADRRTLSPAAYFKRENLKPWIVGNPGWKTLQQKTFNDLIKVSQTLNLPLDSLKYRIFKAELMRCVLTDQEQIQLNQEIEAYAAALPDELHNIEVEMNLHPKVLKVSPRQSERQSHSLKAASRVSILIQDEIMIHKTWDNGLNWTQGNVEVVAVGLENPFAYDLNINSSYLCAEGAEPSPGKS